MGKPTIIAWWSAGITSTVAVWLAIKKYGNTHNIRIIYIETGSANADNHRFKAECEKWYGREIETVKTEKYEDVSDVIRSTGFINSPYGAACTSKLKKDVRIKIERSTEYVGQIFGFEYNKKQINRAVRFIDKYPTSLPLFPLIDERLDKNNCAGIILNAGIELPIMYQWFNNNNCEGCVKGGKGYWNKVREVLPHIFEQRAADERFVGRSCIKGVFLDELDPNEGRDTEIVMPECGSFCQSEFADVFDKRTDDIMSGKIKIGQLLLF
jgi:hypothetical protein